MTDPNIQASMDATDDAATFADDDGPIREDEPKRDDNPRCPRCGYRESIHGQNRGPWVCR